MNTRIVRRGALSAPILATLLSAAAHTDPIGKEEPSIRSTSMLPTDAKPARDFADAPASVRSALTATVDQVLFDEPGDGALWARGQTFKARFDGGGATFVPFLGSAAPKDYPLELRVETASVGGQPMSVATSARAVRDGRRVSIDHGSFVEEYDVELESLEQRFVFDTLPQRGALVVRMQAESELAGSNLGRTLRFENDLGRVDYGEAVALDAAGRRIAIDSTLVDGVIELVVPAAFVDSATLPLVIDPFVTAYTVSGAAHDEAQPDVSYDVTSDKWCVVWTDVYSASDYDVLARYVSGNFTLGSYATVDFTTDFWTTPRIANNNNANDFLVVSAATTPTVVSSIRGRILDPVNELTGPQFMISPNDGAYRNAPDVGGDMNVAPFSSPNYCVVWQRPVSLANVDIEMQLVTTNSTLQGAMTPIDNSSQYDTLPRISKSLGRAAIAQPYEWTVVWQRRITTNDNDIYGAQVLWHGQVYRPTFPIDTSFENDTLPAVSMIMDPLPTYEERPYMVVYQRAYTDSDIIATVLEGSTVLFHTDLSGTFPAPFGNYDQTLPSVECDGSHFLVGHTEKEAFPSNDTNVWVSDYFLSGNALAACSTHGSFAGSPVLESNIALTSMGTSGGPKQHFFGTWTYASANNLGDIQGGLWDACAQGSGYQSFCAGDGSNTACPCGNNGGSASGCPNSVNPSGGGLAGTGNASISGETLVLNGSGMPPFSPSLYFQGTAVATTGASIGQQFGEGLLCLTGTVTRLGIVFNDASGASSFPPSTMRLSTAGGVPDTGGKRYYQIWHRDAANYCTNSGFNLTNALDVSWGW